ncbi:hypothetical protein AAU57_12150 [Nonlabens sp. YIK11]|uniref:hypothetical protein n=1 Tax=Nonlabens sp. YIK11 TaxID=1453349 RepID=UPI0006DD1A97|nr:hypothetical protein [Nonlabens sp. YIK11]KQC33998.1 hypothetical protein AAU57_12150 [Nonlabens sp. YIK11]
MQLELKHLAPYLPYGLKAQASLELYNENQKETFDVRALSKHRVIMRDEWEFDYEDVKPILRPISDLNKGIDNKAYCSIYPLNKYWHYHNYSKSSTGYFQFGHGYESHEILIEDKTVPYEVFEKLFEWHFDVFCLIDAGLAVNINDLNK